MDELRETVLRLMRRGTPPAVVCNFLNLLHEELDTAKVYMDAIIESDMQP